MTSNVWYIILSLLVSMIVAFDEVNLTQQNKGIYVTEIYFCKYCGFAHNEL